MFDYHPDTQRRGAFTRLLRKKQSQTKTGTALPPVEMNTDIFTICRWMLCTCVALEEQMGDKANEVVFHLLIPVYETVVIPRAFVLLDALLP